MKGDAIAAAAAAAIASATAAITATDREIHVIIRGNYHDAPSMQPGGEMGRGGEFGLNLGQLFFSFFQVTGKI